MTACRLGIEHLAAKPELARSWGRVGLLANQASVAPPFRPSWQLCREVLGSRLVALFGPQHGFEATVQDNMIETADGVHGPTGLPVYSLYSHTREPSEAMVKGVDTILIDLQIVGCRVYTFKYTIAGCLRAAKRWGKRVVVLDRPNPLGGELVAGRVLDMSLKSFVGEYPIPMRHGLTAAEAAVHFNAGIGAELDCLWMEHWNPRETWEATGLPWIITSPNLPTLEPVHVYPGTVLLEGTNLSEGRGTGLPFQFVGAPYIKDPYAYAARIRELYGPEGGMALRPTAFQPTSQKWQGESCQGVQIHVLDAKALRAFDLGLAVIRAGIELGGDRFQWKQPPYEYEYEKLPIRLLVGLPDTEARFAAPTFDVRAPEWHEGLARYIKEVAPILHYSRTMRAQ